MIAFVSFLFSPYRLPSKWGYSLSTFCLPQSTMPYIENRSLKLQYQSRIKFQAIDRGAKWNKAFRIKGKFILKMTTKVKIISQRLKDFWWPKKVAVLHCKGHKWDGSKVAQGNQLANCWIPFWTPLRRNPFHYRYPCSGQVWLNRKNLNIQKKN